MAEIIVNIPEDLRNEVVELKLDVSRFVVERIREEVVKIVALKTLANRSHLTDDDAIELGRKLKAGRSKELRQRGF